jgi:hypothetical protein
VDQNQGHSSAGWNLLKVGGGGRGEPELMDLALGGPLLILMQSSMSSHPQLSRSSSPKDFAQAPMVP